MTQSRKMSLIEAVTNVAVGYGLAVVTQIIVFPWFGLEAALGEHLTIGLAFVAVSLARGYLLRRLFEGLRVANRPGDHGGHVEPAQTRR